MFSEENCSVMQALQTDRMDHQHPNEDKVSPLACQFKKLLLIIKLQSGIVVQSLKGGAELGFEF